MYRLLLPLLLCLTFASPAPQTKPETPDSDVTFVKIQPVVQDNAPEEQSKRRESRIENLPLTIPGNLAGSSQESIKDSGQDTGPTDNVKTDSFKEPDLTDLTPQRSEESEQKTDPSENKSDILPAETNAARQGRNYESYETTEFFEIATERYDDVTETPASKRPPKFGQSPKLSYFQKPYERVSTNLIEKSYTRRFRSRCRCEKIWNCPKLQITVPRCPNEYFLCCF